MQDITLPDEYVAPAASSSDLVGVDGNAFAVMGFVISTLRRAGNPKHVITSYERQAMADDYDHLLRVSMAFLDGSS